MYLLYVMETRTIRIDQERPDPVLIQQAAGAVDAGHLVAIPTETVYGIACRAQRSSLAALDTIKARNRGDKPYTVHIASPVAIERFIPRLGIRAKRLIKQFWPGPLTMVFDLSHADMEQQRSRLGAEQTKRLYHTGSIGLRCPDHPVSSVLLAACRQIVVVPSANPAALPPALDAGEVERYLSGKIPLIVDGGACRHGKSSTVIKLQDGKVEFLREGVYDRDQIRQASVVTVLFICTGNTCRSPMAAGLWQRALAKKLRCGVDELAAAGYKALSAGVMAAPGSPATPEAVAACLARGVDIAGHRVTALSRDLAQSCDLVFIMASGHRRPVEACGAGEMCLMLSGDVDVPDPIGGSQAAYEACAEIIEKAISKRIDEFVI